MTTKECLYKKHTPIVSEAERGFFGAELKRKREGKKGRTSMSEDQLEAHLHESKGKDLPGRIGYRKRIKQVMKGK